mgnify:CR=1 FL=1
MEEDRLGRQSKVGAVTPEQTKKIIEENSYREELIFVSGEPTLNPNLPDFVAHAKTCGFRTVGVISNGRRFSYMPYAAKLVKKGMNLAILSIHGGNARLHDGLVRTPGAFDEVKKGLANLSQLKQYSSLRINTSTVLNRRNTSTEALNELMDLLLPHVDHIVFNVMQPFGRGLTHFDRLMMSYTEVADAVGDFFKSRKDERLPVFLVDIPHCVTEDKGIPDRARGYVERYARYQIDRQTDKPKDRDSTGGAPVRKELLAEGKEVEIKGLELKHRDKQEESKKARRAECDDCAYSHVCDGVWKNYIERHGWKEFEPILLAAD